MGAGHSACQRRIRRTALLVTGPQSMGRSLSAQLALASLLSMTAADIIWVFLVAVDVLALDEALDVATPKMVYFSLMAGIAIFSLPLMWWGSRIGYYIAIAFAAISLVSNATSILSALGGSVVQVNILTGMVGIVFSLILLASSARVSRENLGTSPISNPSKTAGSNPADPADSST